MLAFNGMAILVLLARGPHETGWIGWSGGTQLLKRDKLVDLSPQAITEGKRVKTVHVGPEEMGLRERENIVVSNIDHKT